LLAKEVFLILVLDACEHKRAQRPSSVKNDMRASLTDLAQ